MQRRIRVRSSAHGSDHRAGRRHVLRTGRRGGPALDVDDSALSASLTCPALIANATQPVVLLVPGTTLTPDVDFGWNYERALTASGIKWCAVTLPYSATADIQTAGEYVVDAVRTVYMISGRKVHVLGHSQGGMIPRWRSASGRTRAMVDDVVGMAPSNHGVFASAETGVSRFPADWQQASGANFIAALNSYSETFAGINYTNIYSYFDEVVPNSATYSSSSLSTGDGTIANGAVQSICPDDAASHLALGTYDPVAYALVVDAFANGVATASHVPATVCSTQYQPGVDPTAFAQNYSNTSAYITNESNWAPLVDVEPTLAPYVFAVHPG